MSKKKDAALSFLELVTGGRVAEAYEKHIAADFRHHSPWFPGDAASLRAAMQENHDKLPAKRLDVKRAIEEGDLVVVHSHVVPEPTSRGVAVVHIFRFAGDRVVELWDVGQPLPEDSPNANGMF